MPVTAELMDNGRIYKLIVADPWTMSQFAGTYEAAKQVFDSASDIVHTMVDLTRVRIAPYGVLRVREHPGFSHPNAGHVVFFSMIPLAHRIAETAVKLLRFERASFCRSEEEALSILNSMIEAQVRAA